MRRAQRRPRRPPLVPTLLVLVLSSLTATAEPSPGAVSFPNDGGVSVTRTSRGLGSSLTFPKDSSREGESGVKVVRSILPGQSSGGFAFPSAAQSDGTRQSKSLTFPTDSAASSKLPEPQPFRSQRGLKFPGRGDDGSAAASEKKETRNVNFGYDYDEGGYGGHGFEDAASTSGGGYFGGGGYGGGSSFAAGSSYGGSSSYAGSSSYGGGSFGGAGGYGGISNFGGEGGGSEDYGDEGYSAGPHGYGYEDDVGGYDEGGYGDEEAASHVSHGYGYEEHDHEVPHNHKADGKWKKRLIWKPRWKKVWKHAKKQIWTPHWKKTYKPVWKTTWKPDWKQIWIPAWKQIYKPVLVKQLVPGEKTHGTDYEGWEYTSHELWRKKLIWKPYWKKYWKPGQKQIWIKGKKLTWQPAWRKKWVSGWKPIKVPAWKKIWTPVWISEWVPFPKHEEVWDRKSASADIAAEKQDGQQEQQGAPAGAEDRKTRDASDKEATTTGFKFPQVAASAAANKRFDPKISTWSWQ